MKGSIAEYVALLDLSNGSSMWTMSGPCMLHVLPRHQRLRMEHDHDEYELCFFIVRKNNLQLALYGELRSGERLKKQQREARAPAQGKAPMRLGRSCHSVFRFFACFSSCAAGSHPWPRGCLRLSSRSPDWVYEFKIYTAIQGSKKRISIYLPVYS